MLKTFHALSLAALAFTAGNALGQNMPYGAPISLEVAKKVAQAASNKMRKSKQEMTIAVVDSGGNFVYPSEPTRRVWGRSNRQSEKPRRPMASRLPPN